MSSYATTPFLAVNLALVALIGASARAAPVVVSDTRPGPSRPLFDTPEAALALTRSFGSAWQARPRKVDERNGALVTTRYYFASEQRFLRLTIAADGSVEEFYLFAGQGKRQAQDNRCAFFPDRAAIARLLLDAVEPRHDMVDEGTVAEAAKLGWMPLFGLQSAQVNRTKVRFSSFNRHCQVWMRRIS